MRTLAAILLISVVGCSVPSYSLRTSSSTPLVAVNDSPSAGEESPAARPTAVLVPSVRRGHSITWKTGAIITATSVGVSLIGAALTIMGIDNRWENGQGGSPMFWTGIVMSVAGDGGLVLGGPITWMAGIGGPRD